MWANFESSHAANLHCERLTKLPGKNFKYVAQINKAVNTNTHTRTMTHTHTYTYTLSYTRQSKLKELRKLANLVQLLLHPVQVQRNFEAIGIDVALNRRNVNYLSARVTHTLTHTHT